MPGLLDFLNTDQGRMGLGLLAAAGPRTDGAGFGQRLQEGMGSFDAYKANQLKTQHAEMLMLKEQAEMEAAKQAAAMAKSKREALPTLFGGGSAALSPLVGEPGRAATTPRLDVQRALAAGYSPEEIQKLDGLRNVGLDEVSRSMKSMQGGREVEQQFDKFGRPVGQGMEQFRAPIEMDTKDQKLLLDPFTRQPLAKFAMGQSPDSKASNALTRARDAATDSRARERLNFEQSGGMDSGGATQMGLNKQFGKPQAGYRWKSDGSMEFIPGGPADQKAQMKTSGEGTVDSVVADLRDRYTQLNEGGGIVNDQDGMLGNIGARIASTGLGQTIGGAVGTTNQTSRDNIAMTRPLLLQSIMKATGMSAKQMDSNAELKLYLATATDPTKGYQANMDALQRIEDLYGGGKKEITAADPTKPTPAANLMEKLPTANASNKGKKIRDTETGKVLVSNGMTWTEAQ